MTYHVLGSQIVGEDAKEKGTRKVGPPLPSFLPCYFRVCAYSIQRTRLSRSLEQANQDLAKNSNWPEANQLAICKRDQGVELWTIDNNSRKR